MYLFNTILGLIYIAICLFGLAWIAIRYARRPKQPWAEKEQRKPIDPVTHRGIAFRATIHTNPLVKLK